MAEKLTPLVLPPGLYRAGTVYQSKGRWYDAQLVRFFAGTIQPIGGWQRGIGDGTNLTLAALTGVPRAVFAWRPDGTSITDDGPPFIAIGTTQKLYVIAGGTLYDETPAGFTAGAVDSGAAGGGGTYGYSTYGQGVYGVGGTVAGFTNAATWQLDNFGQALAALCTSDGHLYIWAAGTGTIAARPTWSPVFTGSLVTSGATSAGASTIILTATTLTGTILRGQTFIISGTTYTAQNDATAAANLLTVSVTPLVPALINNGTAVTGYNTQAPDGRAVVATPEGFLMVLGADGVARRVRWPDLRSTTQWGQLVTNEAGDFDLNTQGRLMAGRHTRAETLLWTDVDLWAAIFVGLPDVYDFQQKGSNCGLIASNAMSISGTQAIWMGTNAFYAYDGYVREIPCEVADFVFNNINRGQVAKIWSMPMPQYGEVFWYYPSKNSTEIDSYVMWNSWENHWTVGTLARTAGCPPGSQAYPVMTDVSGLTYEHEYQNARTGAAAAYVESGPIELGVGDQVMSINQIVADEKTLGDVTLGFYYSLDPALPFSASSTNAQINEILLTIARFTAAPTDVRLTARQARVRFTENQATGWRVGNVRLGMVVGGRR